MKPTAQFLLSGIISLTITIFNHELAAQKLELVLPVGHTSKITSAEFSPDGKYILTIGDKDPVARIWDVRTGRLFHTLEGHGKGINTAHFSPDGKTIVTASEDQTAKYWDNTGKPLRTLLNAGVVNSANFDATGRFIVSSTENKTFIVWNLDSIKLSKAHSRPFGVRNSFFLPAKNFLAVFDTYSNVNVYKIDSNKYVKSHTTDDLISGVIPSPDGSVVATLTSKGLDIFSIDLGHIELKNRFTYSDINSVQFSSDSRLLVVSNKQSVDVIEIKSGNKVKSFTPKTSKFIDLTYAALTSDSKFIVSAFTGGTRLQVRDYNTGNVQHIEAVKGAASSFIVGHPNNQFIFVASGEKGYILETKNWTVVSRLVGSTSLITNVKIKDNFLFASSEKGTRLWDLQSGSSPFHLNRSKDADINQHSPLIVSLAPNKYGETITVWNYELDKALKTIVPEGSADRLVFNPNGKTFLVYGSYGTKSENSGRIYDAVTFNVQGEVPLGSWGNKIQYSQNGELTSIVSETLNKAILYVRNASTGKTFFDKSYEFEPTVTDISPDNNYIGVFHHVVNKFDVDVIEISSGKVIHTQKGQDVHFSANSNLFAAVTQEKSVNIHELPGGKITRILPHKENVLQSRFDPKGETLLTETNDDSLHLWNLQTQKELKRFKKKGTISLVDWSKELLFTTNRSELNVFDMKKGLQLLSVYAIDSTDWIVKHPSGLFDASENSMNKLYFMDGNDIVEFSQLKERYYEPGLWKKVMSGEKLRDVSKFNSIELPPDLGNSDLTDANVTTLTFTNRNGGIGQISVLINGLEAIEDLRPKGFDPKSKSWTTELKLAALPNLKKGEENLVEVRAWNEGHWVISRPLAIRFTPPATRGVDVEVTEVKNKKKNPSIFILTVGVSDYYGTKIDLKYAAKDAEAMTTSLSLGARKLFGTDSTFVYSLTDNTELKPNKENIKKTFGEIAKKSSPNDVFVVYLSGHGINCCGDDGDFYYLTKDAYATSLDTYKDTGIRASTTISSKELVELFKTVPSDKRVLIIDACASGKMVQNLMASRDIESSTLKALDRMRDRTGFHIITGCAADAVSYEASRFGQGVLTYSLIEGIKGASLKDKKTVDVNMLFQYARERVPVLAKGIGGIQSPQVFSPSGAQSFDIGILDEETKNKIPLPKTRPVYVRSKFISGDTFDDGEKLSGLLDESLNELSSKGEKSSLLFLDIEEFDDACHVSGMYKKAGDVFSLTCKIKCGKAEQTKTLSATGKEKLVELLMAEISPLR